MSDLLEVLAKFVLVAITLGVLAATGFLIYAVIVESRRPTFELVKEDWHCTVSRQQLSTMVVSTGKTTTVIPRTVTVCDQWSRR